MSMTVDDDNKVQGVVRSTDGASGFLTPRAEIAYEEHRREIAAWLRNAGENPAKAEEYSYSTARNRMNKLDGSPAGSGVRSGATSKIRL